MEENFTIREKIAVKLLIVFMVVLKPTKYSHEYTKVLEEIKDLVDKS